MPNLHCPCGFVHNLTPCPDDGWVTVRDREYEALVEKLVADRPPREIVLHLGSLYECPQCHRIMWEKPGDSGFDVWRPES